MEEQDDYKKNIYLHIFNFIHYIFKILDRFNQMSMCGLGIRLTLAATIQRNRHVVCAYK